MGAVVVVGAGCGIGAAIRRMFAERGADLVVTYRKGAAVAEAVAGQARSEYGRRARA
ncbi:SDR family NAD(P)-dependent oxidoreductase [Embleya sp. NPDC059237]|uniref:SDR family NAD(P)-dependent oxidoreductase n=1 Tax=Embleya sp. NPDC059237 TaxID=3346784 RepID=UPI0036C406D4